MEITFIYVTHDQEEALAMSDTVVVMNEGIIQQIGTPEDIYNEPKNAFVADFIGESNILDGIMREDYVVETFGRRFQCMDKGFCKGRAGGRRRPPGGYRYRPREGRHADRHRDEHHLQRACSTMSS